MGGFDNGTLQSGIFAQAKQFGSILRGSGPPTPEAGVVGDIYIDTQTWFLYNKRAKGLDPWGHYLFMVPAAYQSTLKWFSAAIPGNDVGIPNDYCLAWSGFANYGMQPSMYGPKQISGWSEVGDGPGTQIDAAYPNVTLPAGLSDEGPAAPYSVSTQLIVIGLADEYILSIPVTAGAGIPVSQQGLRSLPVGVPVIVNPLYTAEDNHGV